MVPELMEVAGAGGEPQFKMVVRGYDRFEVDAYVDRLHREIKDLEENRSASGAVRRALDQVGDEVAGILQQAHATASEVTTTSKRDAESRLEASRRESEERIEASKRDAVEITAAAENRLRELDLDTDRIWAERDRIVRDARDLARQLVELADAAAARFPAEVVPVDAVTVEAAAIDGETVDAELVEDGPLDDVPSSPE
jgi:DivIVA domain-containing protein